MTADEFRANMVAVFGERGSQAKLAREVGIFPSTIRRWTDGSIPVPPLAAAYIRLRMRYEVMIREMEKTRG